MCIYVFFPSQALYSGFWFGIRSVLSISYSLPRFGFCFCFCFLVFMLGDGALGVSYCYCFCENMRMRMERGDRYPPYPIYNP